MESKRAAPTGVERRLDPNDVILSRTDLRGVITECNDVFADISGYSIYDASLD